MAVPAGALAGVALVAFLADRVAPFFLDLDKPPEVLVHEAQQILKDLGSTVPPAHRAHGFVREGKKGQKRLLFWYRQSPRPLAEGTVAGVDPSFPNPPPLVPGMAGVRLDATGVLVEGARRLAILGAVWGIVGSGPLKDPHVLDPSRILYWVILTLLIIVALWLLYLALEPIVRRRWPDTLVSWTRLLRGRVLDPLVGRDILLGVLSGVALALLSHAYSAAAADRWPASTKQLAGGWYALADRVVDCGQGVLFGLMTLMLLTLLRQLLRRTWAAFAAVILVLVTMDILGGQSATGAAFSVLGIGIGLGLLVWPGLLTAVVAWGVGNSLSDTLMTTHLGEWYAASAVSGILATLAVAVWGFYAALGGRPLFGDPGREQA